jgi:hypothetical protein
VGIRHVFELFSYLYEMFTPQYIDFIIFLKMA